MSGLLFVSVYASLMLVKWLMICNTDIMETDATVTLPNTAKLTHEGRPVSVAFCPKFHHAVELIGRRWTGAIVRAMLSGVTQFSGLRESVPGLSDRMLSERLKELEAEGIVLRTVIPEMPVRITYALTEKGRALSDVLDAISLWAERWLPVAQVEHTPCNTDTTL